MTPLPRTAISLYVALAVHALALLALALHPPSQDSAGAGQGLSVRGAALSAGERRLVEGTSGTTSVLPGETVQAIAAPLPVQERRLARERVVPRAGPAASARASSSEGSGDVAAQLGGGGQDLYFARLRAHLAGFRRVLRPGLPPARSGVRVAITRDGWIEELALVESSGLSELDAEALDLVRRAAPLPPPPQGRTLRLIVPVEIVPIGPG